MANDTHLGHGMDMDERNNFSKSEHGEANRTRVAMSTTMEISVSRLILVPDSQPTPRCCGGMSEADQSSRPGEIHVLGSYQPFQRQARSKWVREVMGGGGERHVRIFGVGSRHNPPVDT